METIGESAFQYCYGIKNFEIDAKNPYYSSADGILYNKDQTELIAYPIKGDITEYSLPDSVLTIAETAFDGCTALKRIDVTEENTAFSSKDGVLFNKDKTTLIKFPTDSDIVDYIIPDSVTQLCPIPFERCKKTRNCIDSKQCNN